MRVVNIQTSTHLLETIRSFNELLCRVEKPDIFKEYFSNQYLIMINFPFNFLLTVTRAFCEKKKGSKVHYLSIKRKHITNIEISKSYTV